MSTTSDRESRGASDAVPLYEKLLDDDPRWALSEGSRHFDEKSAVFAALRKIAKRLDELKIPYAIVGGMALFHHGLRRFTEDVDILVTEDNLTKIHESLEGLGYITPHRHSKHLRDTELGVRIEFLVTGRYPGDGKPKPVVFPDASDVSVEKDGIKYVNLPNLVELKLASGMTNPGRLRDLADVLDLIKALDLRASFAEQLNPYVREQFQKLWRQGAKRYVMSPHDAGKKFDAMLKDGVEVESRSATGNDDTLLVTTDPEIARKYDMVEESEYWAERPKHRANDRHEEGEQAAP